MKISEIVNNRRKTTVKVHDMGTLEITYRPGKVDSDVEERLNKAQSAQNSGPFMRAMVCEVVDDWDLLGDDDQPISLEDPEAEEFRKVPLVILGSIIQSIQEDMRPGEANGR